MWVNLFPREKHRKCRGKRRKCLKSTNYHKYFTRIVAKPTTQHWFVCFSSLVGLSLGRFTQELFQGCNPTHSRHTAVTAQRKPGTVKQPWLLRWLSPFTAVQCMIPNESYNVVILELIHAERPSRVGFIRSKPNALWVPLVNHSNLSDRMA